MNWYLTLWFWFVFLWWLVMLFTFSYIPVGSFMSSLGKCLSVSMQIFKSQANFLNELLVSSLYILGVNLSLDTQFTEILYLILWICIFSLLMISRAYAFGVISKIIDRPMSSWFPMLSSIFMILVHMFKSLIHFELILSMVWVKGSNSFFYMWISVSNTIYWKDSSFHNLCYLLPLSKSQLTIEALICF